MNRRGFLRALAVGVPAIVAPAALVELLAPKRTIFLPPRGGWYSPEVYDIETAIGAELDALVRHHGPIYYNDAGLEMIEARIHAVLCRKIGETDAQLRARMQELYA